MIAEGHRSSWAAGQYEHPAARPAHPLLHYLAGIGLIDPVTPLDQIQITELSRSHSVLSVRAGPNQHLIVKRARPRPGEFHGSLGVEPLVYSLAARLPALRSALPECLWIDPRLQVLVLRAVEPAVSMHSAQYTAGLSPEHARQLGQTLAACHRETRGATPGMLPLTSPWILGLLSQGSWRPPHTEHVLTHVGDRAELAQLLADIANGLEPSGLVHGDLKWDNCLVNHTTATIIDWETAGIGDPAWDVAGIVQDYVGYDCFFAGSVSHTRQAADCLEEFVASYLDLARPAEPTSLVRRAVRLAGARLLQTALEYGAIAYEPRLLQSFVLRAVALMRNPLTPPVGEGSRWDSLMQIS